ncbi:MAG: type II toxin-antitoxin system RelE/ParE family toxin [Verrucomicrobiae bacterium]|nr:type II toxin-antitoxin system RelE/ParE family toxin [Verrucomicrobiae bacterium]
MIPVKFHPEADSEMLKAALYYESQQMDLGKRFLSSVQDAISQIQINPKIFPFVHIDVQRCMTKTFPFNVLFRLSEQKIVIVAVMHQHRHPDYWKNR